MALAEHDRERIENFRQFVEASCANDDRYGRVSRDDRADDTILASRFEAGPSFWFEVAVRPLIPQIRVGFLTDDRWKSEEVEQAIEDSGDTMPEFVEVGFEEAGLDWPDPIVEHYREGGKYFYFSTPLTLEELAGLDQDEIRNKTLRMLEGYLIAFGPAIVVEEEE